MSTFLNWTELATAARKRKDTRAILLVMNNDGSGRMLLPTPELIHQVYCQTTDSQSFGEGAQIQAVAANLLSLPLGTAPIFTRVTDPVANTGACNVIGAYRDRWDLGTLPDTISLPHMDANVAHNPVVEATFKSGARRSEKKPLYGLIPGYAEKLTADRFAHGHTKYDPNDKYADANWLRAVKARDVEFVRQVFSHMRDHLKMEERGTLDVDAGGNLGAMGWALEVLAYVQATDLALYEAAQGLRELQ